MALRTIALGGPDGAGKTTQAERLVASGLADRVCGIWDLLDSGGIPFRSKAEIDAFLKGLHAPARAMFLHMALREAYDRAVAQGGTIVLVGWWPKYNAVERAYGGDPALLDALAAAFPDVDVPLWLDLSPEAAFARKPAVSGYESAGRGASGFVPFQTKVHAELEALLARDPRWIRIDGSGTPDAVAAAIAAHLA